jgi:hypothetical protein
MRGRLTRTQSTASSNRGDDGDSDEDDDDDSKKDENPIDEFKEMGELLTTSVPEHVYPLKILPTRPATERMTQPLLVLPEGPNVTVPFVGTKSAVSNPITEVDLMKGNSTMLNSATGESERLITQNDGKLRGSGEDLDDQTMAMMHAGDSRISGLYVRESPVWASKLLATNESVSESLRDSVDHNMYLARVTQRTLRDLQANLTDLEVRRTWSNIIKGDEEGTAAGGGGRRGRGRVERQQEADEGEGGKGEDITDRSAAASRLLRQVSTGPVLRVIDDPVNDDTTIVSIPEQNKAFGGQLGNWGPDATIKERLGPLNTGDRRSGSRSILRLHVHQLSLKDFPLISLEEKKFNDMKSAFAVYRSLFEHQTLPYLALRVNTVLEELARLVGLSEGGGESLDEEELLLLRSLYYDLTETLPLLRELRGSMDTLTARLFEDWKEIKDIRRSSDGFHGTKANLVVRKLDPSALTHFDADAGVDEGKGGDDSTDSASAAKSWAELHGRLGPSFAELLTKVQALLLESDLEMAKALRIGSDSDIAEETANALKGPRRPARPPRGGRGAGGVSSSDETERPSATARSPSGRAITSAGTKAEELRNKYIKAKSHLIPVSSQIESIKTVYPDYVLRLSEDGEATPQSQVDNDIEESNRRSLMQKTQFKCVIRLNNKVITETKECSLNHSTLTVDVQQYFEFRVLHQPDSLFVDIYAMTPGFTSLLPLKTSVLVASVGVPFPGQHAGAQSGGSGYSKKLSPSAHMFTPVAGWQHFSSPCALFGDLKAPGVVSSGAILCATEYDLVNAEHASSNDASHRYDGVDETNLALLPPRSEGAGSKWGNRFTIGGGLSSAQLLPNLMTMDPNDPRNAMLSGSRFDTVTTYESRTLFEMSGETAVSFKEGLGSYNNYLSFKMGPRLQLLQLREIKPHLFSEPIPNTDEEVSKSALYKQILYQNFPDHLSGLEPVAQDDMDIKTVVGGSGKIKNFLQKVRNSSVAQARRKTKKKLSTSATVAETVYFIPPEEADLADLIPAMKRSLKPDAQPRTAMTMHVDRCNLLVQVVGARNIPLRAMVDSDEGAGKGSSPRKSTKKGRKSTSRSSRSGFSAGAGSDSEGGLSGESGDEKVAVDEALLDEEKLNLRKRAQTCVEVKFQENRESTVRMPGSAPLWKQSIGLPFRAPGDDYSPAALNQVRDDVYFTLFDEVDEDDAFRGGKMVGESTTRTERRFLGAFTIPFSTIYSLGRIEGTFRLQTPLFNFGYARAGALVEQKENAGSNIFGGSDQDPLSEEVASVKEPTIIERMLTQVGLLQPQKRLVQEFGQFIHPKTVQELEFFASGDGSTYIKILATLDPLLATIPKLPGNVSISSLYHDDRNYGPYAQNWLRTLANVSQQTHDRPFKCFGMNSEGLQTLICRYLSPLKPPEGYTSLRSIVHLVSMVPFLSDAQSFQESSIDFWCTTKQAWEVGAGDEEEHGTMLYNYLYYLSLSGNLLGSATERGRDRKRNAESLRNRQGGYPDEDAIRDESVFLVLAEAYPEGEALYVMVRDRNMASQDPFAPRNYILIHPITGFVYSAMDPSCPVRNIACLATPYNIWANVQTGSKPHEISYDILNIDRWRPFFGKRLPPPSGGMHSIQEEVEYSVTSTRTAVDIENAVLAGIRNGIRRWRSKRSRSTTTFHPDGCSIASEMLPALETWRKTGHASYQTTADEPDLELLMEEAERKMAPILRTRTFHGCPVNYSFTDVDDILNKVKALGVHETRHPEVQFVVAAKAFPLFNDTVSLWIFLGVLEANGV